LSIFCENDSSKDFKGTVLIFVVLHKKGYEQISTFIKKKRRKKKKKDNKKLTIKNRIK
jgi:hypothetical protein